MGLDAGATSEGESDITLLIIGSTNRWLLQRPAPVAIYYNPIHVSQQKSHCIEAHMVYFHSPDYLPSIHALPMFWQFPFLQTL